MPVIEFRNGCTVKERQAVQVSKGFRHFVIMSVDLANPVHGPSFQISASGRRLFFSLHWSAEALAMIT
jgi:hypothetical protein